MSKSRLEWKVGLFVLIGLTLLAVLLLQFSKGMSFFRPTYDILVHSSNVAGLKVRAAVLMSGVQVGAVSDIRLAQDGKSVTITLRVYKDFIIYKDAKFLIDQSGFLGDQYIAIMPTGNKGDVFHNNDTAEAEPPFNLQEVARSASGLVQRLDDAVKELSTAFADVRRLLLNPETLTNLSVSVNNLRQLSERAGRSIESINALLETNSPAIHASVTNLTAFSEELNQFGHELNGLVATNKDEIRRTVKNIETSSAVLKDVTQDLQEGKGLAGYLLKNDEIAASVSQIARNLSITSSNLNRLGLWGILWKQKMPRTNQAPAQILTSPKDRD
jgi:phospholipid/cholesterol/gamma-HCH transport system substrate-binding protein